MYRITELDADTNSEKFGAQRNVLPNDALCSTQPII